MVIHHKQEVIGNLPASISIEFKNKVEDIETIQDQIEHIISKYFKDFSLNVDFSDEYEADITLEIILSGISDYISATRDEPAEEEITWSEDYDSLFSKIKKELKNHNDFEYVDISNDDYSMEVYPA